MRPSSAMPRPTVAAKARPGFKGEQITKPELKSPTRARPAASAPSSASTARPIAPGPGKGREKPSQSKEAPPTAGEQLRSEIKEEMQGVMLGLKVELSDAQRARTEAKALLEQADQRAQSALDLLQHAESVRRVAAEPPQKRRRGQDSSPDRQPVRGPTSSVSRGRRRRKLEEQGTGESTSSDPTKQLRPSAQVAEGTLLGMALPVGQEAESGDETPPEQTEPTIRKTGSANPFDADWTG